MTPILRRVSRLWACCRGIQYQGFPDGLPGLGHLPWPRLQKVPLSN